MRATIVSLLLSSLALPAGAAEGPVGCEPFKAGWNEAYRQLDPAAPALSYTPPSGRDRGERVEGLAGTDARLVCAEGIVSHVVVGQSGPATSQGLAPFARAVAALLMGFDPEITAERAAALVAALVAEARPGRDAVSAWGPYELTLGRTTTGGASFEADFPEN